MKMKTLFSALILLLSLTINAQQWQWAVTSGGGGNAGSDIESNNRGGFFVLSSVDGYLTGPYTAQCGAPTRNLIVNYANNGSIIWQTGISANCEAMSVDNVGNIYVVGTTYNNGTFCSVNGTSSVVTQQGNGDAFLAKYSDQGNLLWVKTWGIATTFERPVTIKTDLSGNCYVSGTNYYNNNGVYNNLFICKFDSSGSLLWNKNSNYTYVGPYDIDIDPSGNAYLSGSYNDTLKLDNLMISTAQVHVPFIAKINANGSMVWLTQISTNSGSIDKVKFDKHGYLFLTGSCMAPSNFGGANLTSSGMFLAKYNTSGTPIWVKSMNAQKGTALTTDSTGNCFFGGTFSSPATFSTINGSVTLSSQKQTELFIGKTDINGNIQWVVAPGGNHGGTNVINGIISNDKKELYFTGGFTEITNFGNTTLFAPANSNYSSDVFVCKILDSTVSIITDIKNKTVSFETRIYPNPSDSHVNIHFKDSESLNDLEIIINDAIGKQIYCASFVAPIPKEISINVQSFSRGLYFIKLISKENSEIIKFIKP